MLLFRYGIQRSSSADRKKGQRNIKTLGKDSGIRNDSRTKVSLSWNSIKKQRSRSTNQSFDDITWQK